MRKVLTSVLMVLLSLTACGNRTSTVPNEDRPAGQEKSQLEPARGEEASVQETTHQKDQQPEPAPQGPITMSPVLSATPASRTPAAGSPVARPSVVQPSRSLAGHDRFLVSRPFDGIRPADFELGILFNSRADPSFEPLIKGLARALTEKTLKTAAFNDQALILAELLYNPVLTSSPEIIRLRFSEAKRMPGASYALDLRLFSELGFAKGMALLGADEANNWLIEHLDLDLKGLGEQRERSEPWDPYGYSRNLFD